MQSGSSNFIIYATSNRRHLLPEFMHENTPVTRVDVPQYTELHPQEAIEEKNFIVRSFRDVVVVLSNGSEFVFRNR